MLYIYNKILYSVYVSIYVKSLNVLYILFVINIVNSNMYSVITESAFTNLNPWEPYKR